MLYISSGTLEDCPSGATCEFFLSCWMSGGLLDLPCKGILTGCCFRRGVSKAGFTGGIGIGTIEAPRETGKSQTGPFEDMSKFEF